ncbi:MAG: cell division protein FtsZ, partial [Rubrivivax sp.]
MTGALLALAALVLVALLAHGWWSVRRVSPRQPAPELAAARVDPELGTEPATAPPEAAAEAASPVPQAAVALPVARQAACLDALVDALVPLTVEAPVAGELALAHLPASRRAGSKPMHVEGLEAQGGQWEVPGPGRLYTEFQAGVQLANRGGALNEIEYSEFVQKVQAFAEGVGAMADFPDMLEVVARARERDEFASPLDAQIT